MEATTDRLALRLGERADALYPHHPIGHTKAQAIYELFTWAI